MNKILFLVGPTASGKTEVAINLAKVIGAEIISCDSMQVYKGMDILSQKVSASKRAALPHHMINILSPNKEFSVSDYKNRVEDMIKRIHKRDRIPLIVGGSGLYAKALVDGLFPSEPKNIKLRERLLELSKKYGNKYLHNRLKKIDPETANVTHPNNTRRIIRALEVYETSGLRISAMKTKTKGLSSKYDITILGLRRQRKDLYERINERVHKMFKNGLIKEVKTLKKYKISKTAKSILGYKEVTGYLEGKCTKKEASELLKRNTRHFAKRQISWFKKDPRIIWIDVNKNDTEAEIVNKILRCIKSYGRKSDSTDSLSCSTG